MTYDDLLTTTDDVTAGMCEMEAAISFDMTHKTQSLIPTKQKQVEKYRTMAHGNIMVAISAMPPRISGYTINPTERRASATVGDLTATFAAVQKKAKPRKGAEEQEAGLSRADVPLLEYTYHILTMPARQLLFALVEVLTQKLRPISKFEQGRLIEYSEKEKKEQRTVYLQVNDYLNGRGRPFATSIEKRKARQALNQNLAALHSMSLNWEGPGGKFDKMNVFSQQGSLDGDTITVVFNHDFVERLKKCGMMQVSTALRYISDTRPNAFGLCVKMCHHLSIDANYSKKLAGIEEKKKVAEEHGLTLPDEEISFELRTASLSVHAMLEFCPELPKYAKVKRSRGSASQKILAPFIDNLESLKGGIEPFLTEYTIWKNEGEGKKRELTKEEFVSLPFTMAEMCIIKFTAKYPLPDAEERLARKEVRKQKNIARKKKREEEAKAKEAKAKG